jgi:hypothetical protein
MHHESNYDSYVQLFKDNLGILGLATLIYQSTGLQYSMLAIKQKT